MCQLDRLQKMKSEINRIARRHHADKVYVFGSCARKEETPDSDIDLLVLLDTEAAPLHVAAEIAAAIDHPFPLDILVATPSSFDAALERNAIFMTEVKTNGVVLYEA